MGLKNVKEINGQIYFVKMVRGKLFYDPLPKLEDPKFAIEYERVKERYRRPDRGGVKKGSFAALIKEYRTTPAYRTLSTDTKKDYDRYLDDIERRIGSKNVASVRSSMIERLRDEMQDTPGKANNWLKVMANLLALGKRRDYCSSVATDGIEMLGIGEHLPWPQSVIDHVLADASPTTRLAVQTGLYSGQRISDCIRITHAMMVPDIMHLIQHKQRAHGDRHVEVWIPIHPGWREAVEAVPRRAETILYDRLGNPFKRTTALQERIRDMMRRFGYVDREGQALYTFHGLRKNSSIYLAEMGLSEYQIGAINGMSPETVRHYTKGVVKKRLVESAKLSFLSGDPSSRV